jgi:hypothetical protein
MFALRAAPPTPVSDRRLERVAGWPVLPDVELNRTSGVALDSRGRIYVAHRGERPLLRLHPDGTLEQEIGSQHLHKSIAWDLGGPVPEPMPERYWLLGLHVDPWDNVWITDVSRHLVMQFDPEGVLRRTFGTDSVPGCDADHFDQPTQVCVLPTGEFFVSDGYGNSRIAKFSADGRFLFDWGRRGTGPSEFHSPHDMALGANGLLYVSDRENDRIQAFHPEDGSLVAIAPDLHSLDGLCATPDGALWASAGVDNAVLCLDLQVRVQEAWVRPDLLTYPHAIAVGEDGAIYVAETGDVYEVTGRLPSECTMVPREGSEGSALGKLILA